MSLPERKGRMDMNKKTVALTEKMYQEIIDAMRNGFSGCRPNNRIATILVLEANLGLRISDILTLRLCDIKKDGGRYRLDITEQKTGKKREFTVPAEIYSYIASYCIENEIGKADIIFPIGERTVQKQLKTVCDWLGEEYKDVSTHSFRKYFATNIYLNNNYNIVLVQQLLQHSSAATTQKYIGIGTAELEKALHNHINLL